MTDEDLQAANQLAWSVSLMLEESPTLYIEAIRQRQRFIFEGVTPATLDGLRMIASDTSVAQPKSSAAIELLLLAGDDVDEVLAPGERSSRREVWEAPWPAEVDQSLRASVLLNGWTLPLAERVRAYTSARNLAALQDQDFAYSWRLDPRYGIESALLRSQGVQASPNFLGLGSGEQVDNYRGYIEEINQLVESCRAAGVGDGAIQDMELQDCQFVQFSVGGASSARNAWFGRGALTVSTIARAITFRPDPQSMDVALLAAEQKTDRRLIEQVAAEHNFIFIAPELVERDTPGLFVGDRREPLHRFIFPLD